jgi:hypothetical protein
MTTAAIPQRQTKYCQAIENVLAECGHATNAELLIELQKSFPDVSATTVHRATGAQLVLHRLRKMDQCNTMPIPPLMITSSAQIAGYLEIQTSRAKLSQY